MNSVEGHVLGVLDIAAALVLLWAMQRITGHAGLNNQQARWALIRRVTYALVAIALFGLGVGRLSGTYVPSGVTWTVFQVILLIYIILFPMLRALDVVSQDSLKERRSPRNNHHRTVRR